MPMMDGAQVDREVGRVLRALRRRRRLSLRELNELSQGRFKPSSIASYERAERTISVARFCELCSIYDFTPDSVLAAALAGLWAVAGPSSAKADEADVPESAGHAGGSSLAGSGRGSSHGL